MPSGFRVLKIPPDYILHDRSIEPKDGFLGPFTVKSVKLVLQGTKPGVFGLKPRVIYVDDLDETKIAETEEINLNSELISTNAEFDLPKTETGKLKFNSIVSQQIFDFLASAFKEDYVQQKLAEEQSGWRTLMDIIKQTNVSKHCLYGFPRGHGHPINDLEHAGLIEARLFAGERGRGGKILRVRVAHKEENVSLYLNLENS